MAFPLPQGLVPSEVAFLCEMEMVTVIPLQKLDRLQLLGGTTPELKPDHPAAIPLWLAMLLKRQRRARINPPPWLSVESLTQIIKFETDEQTAEVFSPQPALPRQTTDTPLDSNLYLAHGTLEPSPPFLKDSNTARAQADALPYHWLEMGNMLLSSAPDDFVDADIVRRLLRDLRDIRMSKLRRGFKDLDAGAGIQMNGVGAMEIAEVRGFVSGVIDGLRRLNKPREEAQAEADDYDEDFASSYRPQDEDDDLM
ncbi:GINS complex, PSF2 component [Piedraia hortae CBS 480.64]|uniref:DNA replication complex GINS protein PSF2 n=1 Tax=Piedraia hortae CBS 480.64 TaxID=1314780 RepID=A0A6A7C9W8_9PEZI|nr:GINS complex, PSF2 component [Piedraia hortae CBS 480.64]